MAMIMYAARLLGREHLTLESCWLISAAAIHLTVLPSRFPTAPRRDTQETDGEATEEGGGQIGGEGRREKQRIRDEEDLVECRVFAKRLPALGRYPC